MRETSISVMVESGRYSKNARPLEIKSRRMETKFLEMMILVDFSSEIGDADDTKVKLNRRR